MLRDKTAAAGLYTNLGASVGQLQNVIDNSLTEQLSLYSQDRAMNHALSNQNESLRFTNDSNALRSQYQKKLNDGIAAGTIASGTNSKDCSSLCKLLDPQ